MSASGDSSGPTTDTSGSVMYDVADNVARLTINRPERRNALSWELVAALRSRLNDARNDPGVRVVVLTGAGDKAFCAGADLSGMAGSDTLALHEARGELAGLFCDLWELGKPTIAEVRGFALAGGMGLALSCDLVIAADTAVFATPEIDVGLWPFMVTVPMLRSMPPKRALELMMTGRRVGADEAVSAGFVTVAVPEADLSAEVDRWCTQLAAKPPGAMRLGRSSFYAVIDASGTEALSQLHALLGVAANTAEAAEGLDAFTQKRRPQWQMP